jgi:hypothetical protein
MKQKKIKIASNTLFVYKSKFVAKDGTTTDPTTPTTNTVSIPMAR